VGPANSRAVDHPMLDAIYARFVTESSF
jgi:hypothetical protein